jgi:hypothetical protein
MKTGFRSWSGMKEISGGEEVTCVECCGCGGGAYRPPALDQPCISEAVKMRRGIDWREINSSLDVVLKASEEARAVKGEVERLERATKARVKLIIERLEAIEKACEELGRRLALAKERPSWSRYADAWAHVEIRSEREIALDEARKALEAVREAKEALASLKGYVKKAQRSRIVEKVEEVEKHLGGVWHYYAYDAYD